MRKKLFLCLFFQLFYSKASAHDFGAYNTEQKACSLDIKKTTFDIITPEEYTSNKKPSITSMFLSFEDAKKTDYLRLQSIDKPEIQKNSFCISINPKQFKSKNDPGFVIAASNIFWITIKPELFVNIIIDDLQKLTKPAAICKKLCSLFCEKINKTPKPPITIALLIFNDYDLFDDISL